MARPDVLAKLKSLGWDGPTSYTLPYLNEMISHLEGGMSVDQLKESRKKTSSPDVKGNGAVRQPKGEWVDCERPGDAPEDGGEMELDGIKYACRVFDTTPPQIMWQRFVPKVKEPKQKPEKGTWEALVENPGIEVGEASGEAEHDGVRYRWNTVVGVDDEGKPSEEIHVLWEKFVPTVKGKKVKLPGQEASFDPRAMLRVFENDDMRIRTGGRDWTMIDIDFLQSQLDGAQGKGDVAVLVEVDGSMESCDVVWLEALLSVKRRLVARGEEVNGDSSDVPPMHTE